jgi:hypothetical protein
MRHKIALTRILVCGISLLLSFSAAESGDQGGKAAEGIKGQVETPATGDALDHGKRISGSPAVEARKKPLVAPVGMPVYRPPLRGAPVGRIAGGSRGIVDEYPTLLVVLSPDHTGLTTQEQPSLYWFLAEMMPHPIELTIIEEQAIYPILETRITSPQQPGVQRISLADYNVRLKPDVKYRWFVAMVPDRERRSKDILAWGEIERVEPTAKLQKDLAEMGGARSPYIYAEEGLWYDAFSAVSDLINTAPDEFAFRKQRASLLEQVGLPQIAKYDMEQAGSGGR